MSWTLTAAMIVAAIAHILRMAAPDRMAARRTMQPA